MTQPRLAAILALVLAALTLAAVAYSVIASFPRGPILAALLVGAAVAGWYGLIRRGTPRVVGLGLAATLVLTSVLIVILDGGVAEFVVVGATGLRHRRRDQGRLRGPRAAPGRRGPGAARSCSSTRSPAAARRSGSSWPTRRGPAGSSRSS